ncbi:unnamed protein product [Brassica oleracea]
MSVFDFFTTQAKYGLTVGLRMSSWSGKTSSGTTREREEEESSTGEYELEIEAITYSLRRPSKLILYLQKLKQLSGLDIRVCLAYAAEYYIFLLLSLPSYSHLDLSFYFKRNSWSEVVHSKLICIMTNMIYRSLELDGSIKATSSASSFLIEQVDLIGGVEFILYKYSLATTREERRNLYSVLFDYVLHQINEACAAAGLSEYTDDEIQPLAVRLALADAPEAFYISVKLGVEGIGKILRRSIAASLSGFSNSERLNQSKNSVIRWGFLFILERLLMRSKFLLDENETQRSTVGSASQDQKDTRLEKANAVIDIMCSALSLMAQINETDRLNILKMCDILFSQLCLKVLSTDEEAVPSSAERNNKFDTSHRNSYKESMDDADIRPRYNNVSVSTCETASMAAMLLRG